MITWLMLTSVSFGAPSVEANAQLLRPSVDAQGTLWSEDSHFGPSNYATFRSYMHYAHRPLRVSDGDDRQTLVSSVAELDLMGAFTFRGLRVGAHLPVMLYSAGQFDDNEAGLGDVAFDVKGRVMDRDSWPVGVALQARLTLPTASVDVPLGDAALGYELTAIADRMVGDFLFTANAGVRDVARTEMRDAVYNDAVFGRLGATYFLTSKAGISGELAAQTNLSPTNHPGGTPAETLVSGFGRVNDSWVLRGGGAVGLSRSPGAAVFRGLVGVGFEPDPFPDADNDGIVDKLDACPHDAEDVDGYKDFDGCEDSETLVQFALNEGGDALPSATTLSFASDSGVIHSTLSDGATSLHPGRYKVSIDAPGYHPSTKVIDVDASGKSVLKHELLAKVGSIYLTAVDGEGQPLQALVKLSDADAVPIGDGHFQMPEGEHALVVTADEHVAFVDVVNLTAGEHRELAVVLAPVDKPVEPTMLLLSSAEASAPEKVLAKVEADRIEIEDKIFFDLDEATIQSRSFPVLKEVARLLNEHPELAGVEVSGHTDARGSVEHNRDLSAARAQAVKDFLLQQGVDAGRLRSTGYGADELLDERDTEQAHERNRRVEFRIQQG